MTRRVLLGLGLLCLAIVWLVPWTEMPFASHMTRHMGVVALAAPLLALGLAGSRLDPALRAPALFSPIPASVVELLVVWGWHAPVLHQAARDHAAVFFVEQASFLGSGLLVWLAALGGGIEGRLQRRAAGVVALLLTSMHMTLLGALLALPPRPLYQAAPLCPPERALSDQHLGGAIMLIVGGVSYLAGGVGLMAGLLRRRVGQP